MNFSQITDITIPEGTVTQITANSAVLWKKVTTPQWTAWTQYTSSSYSYYGNVFQESLTNLNITEPPSIICIGTYIRTGSSSGATNWPITINNNNYLVDSIYGNAQTLGTSESTAGYCVIYPKWTISTYSTGILATCNLTTGSGYSAQGIEITYDSRPSSNFLQISRRWPSTNYPQYKTFVTKVLLNYDEINASINYPLHTGNTLNWTWDYASYSTWGSGLTRLQSYTVPLTVAKVKFSQFNITSNFTTNWYIDFSAYQSTSSRQITLNIPISELPNYTFILGQYQLTRYTTESQNLVFRLYTTINSTTYYFYFNMSTYQGSSNKRLDLIRGSHSTASPFTLNPVFTFETLPQ